MAEAAFAAKGRPIMRKVALSLALIGLAWPFLGAAPAQAQAQRTWVSSAGDDANPCSRTAPCRTFQGALAGNKTAAGGEINCIDAGDFGQVTITFSITISCAAGTAGILAANFQGIFINAAATDVVTLRGLDIDGQGTGDAGMLIASAGSVRVEKCIIRNFRRNGQAAGITTSAGPQTIFLYVAETVISDNWNGIRTVQSDGTNNTGGSNGGVGVPNATLTKN